MHTSGLCVHLCKVCACAPAANFRKLLCLLITVKRRQLETETHQGIKGISVGWCVRVKPLPAVLVCALI